MIIFITRLSEEEVKQRFFSKVTISKVNLRRFMPRIFLPTIARGNIDNDKIWFDFAQYKGRFPSSFFPGQHEFKGKIYKENEFTIIEGKYTNYWFSRSMLLVFLWCSVLSGIFSVFELDSITELFLVIVQIGFPLLIFAGFWFLLDYLKKGEDEESIQYFSNLFAAEVIVVPKDKNTKKKLF